MWDRSRTSDRSRPCLTTGGGERLLVDRGWGAGQCREWSSPKKQQRKQSQSIALFLPRTARFPGRRLRERRLPTPPAESEADNILGRRRRLLLRMRTPTRTAEKSGTSRLPRTAHREPRPE